MDHVVQPAPGRMPFPGHLTVAQVWAITTCIEAGGDPFALVHSASKRARIAWFLHRNPEWRLKLAKRRRGVAAPRPDQITSSQFNALPHVHNHEAPHAPFAEEVAPISE